MKKILFRKLLYDYLRFFFITLISTSVVIWVFQSVNFLDIMIEDGRDYLVYINYSLLNFPKILSKIFPFILFFSLFYVTVKYELNNELIIFWNFGVHKISIINFIFKISIVLMVIQVFFTTIIVPSSQDLARSFLRSSEVNFFDNFVKQQKFNDTIKGVTIYADKKNSNGNLKNLYLKKEIKNSQFQITYAKRGEFSEIGGKPILILFDGATITSNDDNSLTNISFTKSDYSLSEFETNTITVPKTQEISSIKLIKCLNYFFKFSNTQEFNFKSKSIENCRTSNMNNILKEFYKRFIIPIYIPILSLIPFLLIVISKENSKYQKLRLFTFIIGLIFVIFSETTIRFISTDQIQSIIFLLLPIVFFIFIYLYFFLNFNQFPKELKK
ncbi:LptF/LptG family permease [Candidatus Pelagibacter sp.]|nr:LptF/LptG family permease [Candidatus Pelagibacter sp.]